MGQLRKMGSAVFNEFFKEGTEFVQWTLYDSVLTTAATAQNQVFFQNTIGSVTISRTNMQSAGQLPKPKSFLVTDMCIKLVNIDGASFEFEGAGTPTIYPPNAIFSRMTGIFFIDPSRKFEWAQPQYNTQIDIFNDGAATPIGSHTLRQGPVNQVIPLKIPLILGANRAFNVELNFTTPAAAGGYTAANTLLYIFLGGYLKRNK